MRNLLYILLLPLFLLGCRCDTIEIENGQLTESALAMVPYKNGEYYRLQHAYGKVITFETLRASHQEWTSCHRCCEYSYHFEVNQTKLLPDYPIFNIDFEINNSDTANISCNLRIGNAHFTIPSPDKAKTTFDDIVIDTTHYHNVLTLRNRNEHAALLNIDSLYYNYQNGILKIFISNGEYFTIYQ